MMYGQCETYGTKGFDFFGFLKEVTAQKKGWIEVNKKVDLDLDNHEEEN